MAKAEQKIERERAAFNQLLAINPNYFGNLAESQFKPVKKIIGNTKYEEVSCVGFNPDLNILEATIQIKLPSGYMGNLCQAGSTEYVRFFVDYNDGAGWQDAGVSGFNIHDIPTGTDCARQSDKPLVYVVTKSIQPKRDYCGKPVLPNVRAILSWQILPPPNPNWPPVWGNVLDRHIQIKPRRWWIKDIVDLLGVGLEKPLKLPLELEAVKFQPIPLPDPPPFALSDLVQLYSGKTKGGKAAVQTTVEPHRFGMEHLQMALAPVIDQQALSGKIQEWQALGLDWETAVSTLIKTSGNVTYEELKCLGLEYNQEWLIATFTVKKPNGFSGTLCQPGSKEYVAFWADWDNTCQWTYLNTVAIEVHDIPGIPADGLHYAAMLPVNLDAYRQPCQKPKIGRIRAVLSWNAPPSTVDPDAIPYWGNRLDTHVQIRPGKQHDPGDVFAHIRSIGGIPIEDIDTGGDGMTMPGAKFWYNDAPADEWGLNRDCPFGGQILVHGQYFPGFKYRVRVREVSDPLNITTLTTPFDVLKWPIGSTHQVPDADGFFTYLDPVLHFERILAVWSSSGDEQWELQLDVADMASPPNVLLSTPWLKIQLDNTAPDAEIHIDSGGDCKDFTAGTAVDGHFVARDIHFGAFSLDTLPNSLTPPDPTTVGAVAPFDLFLPATSQTALPPGHQWHLETGSMQPCGYVVLLQVWDRTIVGSQSGSHNYRNDDVGFCLRAKSK
jgi:hypothetical protein